MTAEKIRQAVDSAYRDGDLVIDDQTPLFKPFIDLLRSSFSTASLRIESADGPVSTPTGALVSGTGDVLDNRQVSLEASFDLIENACVFTLRIRFPKPWTHFDQLYPHYKSTLIGEVAMRDAGLVLSSTARTDPITSKPLFIGLNILATVDLPKQLSLLPPVLAVTGSLEAHGLIEGTREDADVKLIVELESATLKIGGLQAAPCLILNGWTAKLGEKRLIKAGTRLGVIFQLGEALLDLTGQFSLDSPGFIMIRGEFVNTSLPTPEDVAQLIGAKDFDQWMPPPFRKSTELKLLGCSIGLDLEQGHVTSMTLEVGMPPRESWDVADGMALSSVRVSLAVTNPFGARGLPDRRPLACASASMLIQADQTLELDMGLTVPSGAVYGRLKPNQETSLKSLAAFCGMDTTSLPDLTCSDFGLYSNPSNGTFAFDLGLKGDWSIALGGVEFELGAEAGAHLLYGGGNEGPGEVYANVSIGDAFVIGTWTLPKDFRLFGCIHSVNLHHILKQLGGGREPFESLVGGGFQLTLESADFYIEKSESRFTLGIMAATSEYGALAFVVREEGIVVGYELPDDWNLSALPDIPDAFDPIEFDGKRLVMSSFSDQSFAFPEFPDFSFSFPRDYPGLEAGISMYATLKLNTDDLLKLSKIVSFADSKFDCFVQIRTKPVGATLSAAAVFEDGGFRKPAGLTLLDPAFFIKLEPEEGDLKIGISGGIRIAVPGGPLVFTGALEVEDDGVVMEAKTGTPWSPAFGIEGLDVQALSLDLGIDTEGIPTVGVSGELSIGEIAGGIALNFNSANPDDSLLAGNITDTSLADLVRGIPCVVIPDTMKETLKEIGIGELYRFDVPASERTALDQGKVSEAINSGIARYGDPPLPPSGPLDYQLIVSKARANLWYILNRKDWIAYQVRGTRDGITVHRLAQISVWPTKYLIGGTLHVLGEAITTSVIVDFALGASFSGTVDKKIQIGKLLEISNADQTGGPSVSFQSYSQGGVGPHLYFSGRIQVGQVCTITNALSVDDKGISVQSKEKIYGAFDASIDLSAALGSLSSASFVFDAQLHLQDIAATIESTLTAAAAKTENLKPCLDAIRQDRETIAQYQGEIAYWRTQKRCYPMVGCVLTVEARLAIALCEKEIASAKTDIYLKEKEIEALSLGDVILEGASEALVQGLAVVELWLGGKPNTPLLEADLSLHSAVDALHGLVHLDGHLAIMGTRYPVRFNADLTRKKAADALSKLLLEYSELIIEELVVDG